MTITVNGQEFDSLKAAQKAAKFFAAEEKKAEEQAYLDRLKSEANSSQALMAIIHRLQTIFEGREPHTWYLQPMLKDSEGKVFFAPAYGNDMKQAYSYSDGPEMSLIGTSGMVAIRFRGEGGAEKWFAIGTSGTSFDLEEIPGFLRSQFDRMLETCDKVSA